MREDVKSLLLGEYNRTVNYQKRYNKITVEFSFEEYLTLWSKKRLASIELRIDRGPKSVQYYMRGSLRPVVGWRDKSFRVKEGTMSLDQVRIMSAEDQKRLFQFKPGDKHSEETKALMRQPKSEAQKAKMKLAQQARRARELEKKS